MRGRGRRRQRETLRERIEERRCGLDGSRRRSGRRQRRGLLRRRRRRCATERRLERGCRCARRRCRGRNRGHRYSIGRSYGLPSMTHRGVRHDDRRGVRYRAAGPGRLPDGRLDLRGNKERGQADRDIGGIHRTRLGSGVRRRQAAHGGRETGLTRRGGGNLVAGARQHLQERRQIETRRERLHGISSRCRVAVGRDLWRRTGRRDADLCRRHQLGERRPRTRAIDALTCDGAIGIRDRTGRIEHRHAVDRPVEPRQELRHHLKPPQARRDASAAPAHRSRVARRGLPPRAPRRASGR